MNIKEEIEKLLLELKNKNIDRRQIEKDLGLSEFYLDQAISRGGNKSIYKRIKQYYEAQKITENYTVEDRAIVKNLVNEMIKLKAKITGVPEHVWQEEFDRNTSLIANDLHKKL